MEDIERPKGPTTSPVQPAPHPRLIRVAPHGDSPAESHPRHEPDAEQAVPAIAFTRFEETGGAPLTKKFELDSSGKIRKTSQTQLCRAIAQTVEIEALSGLPSVLDGLTYNQCISTGVFDIPQCEIVLDRELTDEAIASGKRSRTKRFLKAPVHALVLLDHDASPYAPEHLRYGSPAELMATLAQAVPELETIAYVGAGSSSAGVYNTATGEPSPGGGIHVYISAVGHDPVSFAKTIGVRCWNKGLGHIALAANGSMLPRCPVDQTVFAPERLAYEATPILGAGVSRHARQWCEREGNALFHLAPLTEDEVAECERRISEAMRDPELVRKSAELREAHYAASVTRLAERKGITIDEARERLPKPPAGGDSDLRYLAAEYVVEIKGEMITVEELVARGHEFRQCAMPDPNEGSAYGTSTAKFYFDERNGGVIHSFAHGRKTTYLLLDFAPCEYTQVVVPPDPPLPSQAQPLDKNVFPHMGKYGPLATIDNYCALLAGYGITVRYDVIAKRQVLNIPDFSATADNLENSALAHITSLANLNRLAVGHLPQFLAAIGDQNPMNPVADWIMSEPWDGVDRLPAFYATLTTAPDFPESLKNTLLFRWMLSAVAAALLPNGFKSRGVLVLCGPQSIGKGTWILMLVDSPVLRDAFVKADHHLNPDDKDSILGAISFWIVEFAELEGTFKRRDLAKLKGYVTNNMDRVRRPYDRRESTYPRRTVFAATVNQPDFLVDDTGNTRWWTIPVTAVNYQHRLPMQQIWAQVATIFQAGEQWWLTRDEERALESFNQMHRSASALRDAIMDKFDFEAPKDKWTRQTPRQVLLSLGYEQPNNPLTRECGAILRELCGEPTRSQGKERWLVPPMRKTDMDERLGYVP